MIAAVFFPILSGVLLLISSLRDKMRTDRKRVLTYVGAAFLMTALLVAVTVLGTGEKSVTLFWLMKDIPVYFSLDRLGSLFVIVITIVWVSAGFFSFEYMKHEGKEKRFFGFYLVTFGVLIALCCSGNLVTMYLFYELMTLASMPLVLHNESKPAIMAALKYLFYSMFGAYLSLFGIFVLYHYSSDLTFTAGGFLGAMAAGPEALLLIALFCMVLGFGVKAGMFPMHAWLPTAHPVAPSPASAVLSSTIVKAGVLALIRVIYYVAGPSLLAGTWVQYAWMILSLITVFMGSMLAYREKVFKKRLAYSTVSQVSYILFGLSLMNSTAMTGALLHVVFHAFIKCTLFLTAGVIIYKTGKTNVDDFRGIGKEMPVTIWCYTFASLGLIGIPPASGFISKWYLAQGALTSGLSVFSWLGPVVLLVSALLTAGYLLPVTMKGFLPGADYDYGALQKKEPSLWMLIPLIVLTVLSVGLGVIPGPLTDFIRQIAAGLM
ncbi:MAG: proton-conducting transporter membrane subunit [Lachnospiraceae bacterium]|nr:proton-conducting transporter membrane subunit [Lachnospiraceae bacterium]